MLDQISDPDDLTCKEYFRQKIPGTENYHILTKL